MRFARKLGLFVLLYVVVGVLQTWNAGNAFASQPTLSIDDIAIDEADAGKTPFDFTVTLSAASSETVTVAYVTHDEPWSGAATAGSDYEAKSGNLTFAPGETRKMIRVQVIGDTAPESHEAFGVWLRQPVNATFDSYSGGAYILNDDITFSIADVKVQELDPYIREDNGEEGDQTVSMRVVQAGDIKVGHSASVHFATSDGTASSEDDYESGSGDLSFTYGNPYEFGYFAVHVLPDEVDESDETFYVTLSSAQGATIARSRATITILDDEGSPSLSTPTPQTTPPPGARVVDASAGTTGGGRLTDGSNSSDDDSERRVSADAEASRVSASPVPSGPGASGSSHDTGPSSREEGVVALVEETGPRTSSATRWTLRGIGIVLAMAALVGVVAMQRRSPSISAGGE